MGKPQVWAKVAADRSFCRRPRLRILGKLTVGARSPARFAALNTSDCWRATAAGRRSLQSRLVKSTSSYGILLPVSVNLSAWFRLVEVVACARAAAGADHWASLRHGLKAYPLRDAALQHSPLAREILRLPWKAIARLESP
jgi:hypothetical protein